MNSITITLPMPAMAVSQNASYGNSKFAAIKKSRIVKQHRERARLFMSSILARPPFAITQPLGYSLRFYYKTMMFRDEGNAEGSCKAYIDGIADALKMNDRHFKKFQLTQQAKDATQKPRVEITIYFPTP